MKDKILDIDFSDYQEVGPAPYFLSPIEIIKLQLMDILEEQGFDDEMDD